MQIETDTTLAAIFGAGHVYNPNASFIDPGWMQGGRAMRDFRTGDHLAIAGALPFVCHRAVATPRVAALLRESGIRIAERIETYDAHPSYDRLLESLQRGGDRAVMQHVHPTDELAPDRYWIPRALLCFLNNKGNLAQLVPDEHCPPRRVVRGDELSSRDVAPPVVLKAATDQSSGGGSDVRICRTPAEIEHALRRFESCDRIVVEEFLDIERSYCVQFATTPAGEILTLGMAQQITSDRGRFLGNWFDDPGKNPQELLSIGRAIMERGVHRGYRGVAGFDIALCRDGRRVVLDLNFRLNGSTAPLVLHEALARRLGTPVLRYGAWRGTRGFFALEHTLRWAVRDRIFLPLCIYDPEGTASPGREPIVSGVLAGKTREEVTAHASALAAEGLL